MAMMPYEAEALMARFTPELCAQKPPFFGVNIQDVNDVNVAKFVQRMEPVRERIGQVPGFSVHFRGVSDYGLRKRFITIARYDLPVREADMRRLFDDDPDYPAIWSAVCEVIESYEWFTTGEPG